MLVPEMLCGDTRSVKAACRRHITRFKRGGSWVDAGQMLDVRGVPGLVMLNGPSPLLGGSQIRLYAPFWELGEAIGRAQVAFDACLRAFDEALTRPWSLLGLLSQMCYQWFTDRERAARFLDATTAHWNEMDGIGKRYARGINRGDALWDLPHLLKYVLAHEGVPQPRLVQPLPPGGIPALLLTGAN